MNHKSTYLFIGTTAELIKLIPLIRELNIRKIPFQIIASGQNDIQFDEFKADLKQITIRRAVTPKGNKSSIILFVIWSLRTFFALLKGMQNDFRGLNKTNSLFIVHGDTVSSLMGSLVATVYRLKLVHIESGLRSFNFMEPFPEEICRYIISRLADIHFCPNEWSINNLSHVKGEKVNTYQNTLIESFWRAMKEKGRNKFVQKMLSGNKKFFVLVIHRQEHVLFNKEQSKKTMKLILNNSPKTLQCLFLIHDISTNLVRSLTYLIPKDVADNIVKVKRLPYSDFMHLLLGAEFIITDGGSNQEEMYYMGKPCLLLRNHTERIEGLRKNILLSRNKEQNIIRFMKNYERYRSNFVRIDKRPSKIIVDYLYPEL